MDLLKDSVKKLYFRYLFPSMGSAVVASVYLMTDAVVIGKGIGDNALAALNMTTPIISFMLSIGILFGIGGSVLFSVHKGTGNDEKANKCFTTALIGVLTGAVIICLLCNILTGKYLHLWAQRTNFSILPMIMCGFITTFQFRAFWLIFALLLFAVTKTPTELWLPLRQAES